MKITKTKLKQIIKEELRSIFEGAKKTTRGYEIDLFEFSKLVTSGERQAQISGMSVESGPAGTSKVPFTLVLSVTDEPAVAKASSGSSAAYIDTDLIGKPFSVQAFGRGHTFIVSEA